MSDDTHRKMHFEDTYPIGFGIWLADNVDNTDQFTLSQFDPDKALLHDTVIDITDGSSITTTSPTSNVVKINQAVTEKRIVIFAVGWLAPK